MTKRHPNHPKNAQKASLCHEHPTSISGWGGRYWGRRLLRSGVKIRVVSWLSLENDTTKHDWVLLSFIIPCCLQYASASVCRLACFLFIKNIIVAVCQKVATYQTTTLEPVSSRRCSSGWWLWCCWTPANKVRKNTKGKHEMKH